MSASQPGLPETGPIRFIDTGHASLLYPFTLLRSAADLPVGLLTIREKWASDWRALPEKDQARVTGQVIELPDHVCPRPGALQALSEGRKPEVLYESGLLIPMERIWNLPSANTWAVPDDFLRLTRSGRGSSNLLSGTSTHWGDYPLYIGEGARLEGVTLNTSTGPIYIGPGAEVMEGSNLRGPLLIGEKAVVKMGSQIYGATVIGKQCIAGGEIKQSSLFPYSNKAHHGYLGDSVLGSWCNLGAGSSNSNVKNSAGVIRVWNEGLRQWEEAGRKCGVFVGDFSRSSINTSFNSGTVVGVSASVHDYPSLTPKHIRSFSFGPDPESRYEWERVCRDITQWMEWKGEQPDSVLFERLRVIFETSQNQNS